MLVFTFSHHIAAQNLIPNPSFEDFNDYGQPNLYYSWEFSKGCTHWYRNTTGGSDIWSDSIRQGFPSDKQFYRPHHGQAFARIMLWNSDTDGPLHKKSMQAQLNDSLKEGCYYKFSMYVLPEAIYPFERYPSNLASLTAQYAVSKSFGAYFSKDPILDTVSPFGHEFDSVDIRPQIKLPQDYYITDTTNYTRVSGIFKADGEEQYITLSHFGWIDTMTVYKFRDQQTFGSNEYWRVKLLVDSLNLYQIPPPDSLLTTSRDTNMCPGDTLQLFVNARDALSYQWDDNSTDSLRTITQPGTYYVDAFYPCGDILSDTIVVSAKDVLPTITLNDTAMCEGEAAHYKVPPGPVYTLNNNPVDTNFDISIAGQYSLTATNTCESDTFTFEVSYLQVPSIPNIVIPDTALCEGEEMQVTLPDSLSYELNSIPVKQNPITISERNDYELLVDNGCETHLFRFTVNDEGCETLLFAPNAFTPDGDGVNDCFEVSVIEQLSYHIMIFNRWGQMVYESHNPDECWDGTYKGTSKADVYTYLIVVGAPGREIKKRGMVQALK